MPPVQPSPTMTTSTSLSLVVMTCPSTHVRDAERLGRERLAAILLDVIAVHGNDSGKADDRPSRLVAVAAIDRIGVHALDHGLIQRGPEHPHRQSAIESDLAGGQTSQHLLALRILDPVEGLAVSLEAMRVGRSDPGTIELRRCQRQLIALARRALLPGSLHIEPIALAPAAGECAIDIDVDAEI